MLSPACGGVEVQQHLVNFKAKPLHTDLEREHVKAPEGLEANEATRSAIESYE